MIFVTNYFLFQNTQLDSCKKYLDEQDEDDKEESDPGPKNAAVADWSSGNGLSNYVDSILKSNMISIH